MRYTYFEIENYKGIQRLRLDLDPGLGIYTLVGLNESGKTTILEAINSLAASESTNPAGATNSIEARELMPRRQSANFTGEIEVRAGIILDEEDKVAIARAIEFPGRGATVVDEDGFIVLRLTFKLGKLVNRLGSGVAITVHKATAKSSTRIPSEALAGARTVAMNRAPRILYFPNFLVDIPEKIYVEPKVVLPDADVHAYYRALFEDIFRDQAQDFDLKALVLDRMDEVDDVSQDQVKTTLRHVSASMTNVILDGWKQILKRKDGPGRVELDYGEDANGKFFRIQITKGVDTYKISERSLGFRWYFAYVLLTHYRLVRDQKQGIIYLFDEPASNLHSAAQQRLLANLADLQKRGGTVIYTTHSHHMIKPEWLEGAYVVENTGLSYEDEGDERTLDATNIKLVRYRKYVHNGVTNTTHIQPIIEALDYQPGPLEFQREAILVEGKNDYYSLRYFAHLLGEQNLHIVPGMSGSGLSPIVSIYVGWGWPFLVLHDGDIEGQTQHDKLREAFGLVPERHFVLLTDIVASTKVKAFESLVDAQDRLTIQQATGRPADKYSKKNFNHSIHELLAREQAVDLSDETKDRLRQVFHGLRERLKELG